MNPSQVPVPYVNAVESASYHNIKYPSLRQMSNYRFDKSTLRHLSRVPRMNSAPVVRIAPPEPLSINLINDKYININDRYREEIKNDGYFQVFKDMSRKRNYIQEETDRVDSTPKKSRRNDIKNFMTPHYKRSHDDSSNDNLEDTTRKKRCSDSDRSVAKMMSYTSSMSVLARHFTWSTQSKKRKSSRIEKSKHESPEQVEKLRKIADEECDENVIKRHDEQGSKNSTYVVQQHIPSDQDERVEEQVSDETDSRSLYEPHSPDDDGEYVKVASGKILNRTNCMYRKKLNSNKIDPKSVITLEPELVNGSSHEDDDAMKENLLKNLIDDIERKGEKNESVIFYENSIVEDIAKNQKKIEEIKQTAVTSTSKFIPQTSVINENKTVSEVVSNTETIVTNTQNNFSFPCAVSVAPSVNSPSFEIPVPSSQQNNPVVTTSSVLATPTLTFGESSLKFSTDQVDSKEKPTNSIPQSNIVFQKVENEQKSSPSQVTMFGNITMSPTITATNTFKSSPTVSAAPVQKPNEGFQFGQNSGFAFGVAASTADGGFKSETTTVTTQNNFSFPSAVNNSASFNLPVSSPQQNPIVTTSSVTATPILTFGGSSLKFNTDQVNGKEKQTSGISQNMFQKLENDQKNSPSQVTMFGNVAMSPITTATNTFKSSPTVSAAPAPKPSGGFQFGQNSGGFAFGLAASTGDSGFKTGTTTTPTSVFNPPTSFSTPMATSQPQTNSTFGTAQPTGFGNVQNSVFGSGSGDAFGQTAPQFGAANQPAPQFGSSGGFSFGNTNPPPAFGSTTTPFANNTQQANFNSPSTFNFNAGASSFGATPAFGTAPSKPENAFAFGSAAPISQPAQNSVFQFGTPAAPQNQPFTFAAGSGNAAAGGFSIGAGGTSRSRANRNRRIK